MLNAKKIKFRIHSWRLKLLSKVRKSASEVNIKIIRQTDL